MRPASKRSDCDARLSSGVWSKDLRDNGFRTGADDSVRRTANLPANIRQADIPVFLAVGNANRRTVAWRRAYRLRVKSVGVLGGGVGGLSAAHELAERGFDVTVYEQRAVFGGKARSVHKPRSGKGGRKPLPGEHGFRFFPGFYRHLTDTMSRIPCPDGTVAHHLVDATRILLAREGVQRNELIVPAQAPRTFNDFIALTTVAYKFGFKLGIHPTEIAFFVERLMTLLSSCDERRYNEFENQSWWDFVQADKKSPGFQKFLADGLTRTLVAARAKEMSARTGGLILCQLLLDMARVGAHVDRVLDGPTSDVWIDPWLDRLKRLGVKRRAGCEVTRIHCKDQRITGVELTHKSVHENVGHDYYIAALPVERLITLLNPDLCSAEPRLALLPKLKWRWMNGVQYYLDRDVPLQRGHTIFIDSPWSLTAISQAQFWPSVDFDDLGNGKVDGILSVDVSEWERVSPRTGLTAKQSTKKQIFDEVWAQMADAINDGTLDKSNIVDQFLDPDVVLPNLKPKAEAVNLEPLLINTAGSWRNRPDAVTDIENFFLAADFVRTYTDLATMEGANEAARRAVNGLLDADKSAASRCEVWKLHEPAVFAPLRALDSVCWRLEAPLRALGVKGCPGR